MAGGYHLGRAGMLHVKYGVDGKGSVFLCRRLFQVTFYFVGLVYLFLDQGFSACAAGGAAGGRRFASLLERIVHELIYYYEKLFG